MSEQKIIIQFEGCCMKYMITQLSCLLSRSGSISCLFACLWWKQHFVIQIMPEKRFKMLYFHTTHRSVGKVEEGEEENPSNRCKFQLFSLLACTLLLCNNAVIGDNHPTRWFKLFSAFSCFFWVPFLWGNFTLKLFNQNSDCFLKLW